MSERDTRERSPEPVEWKPAELRSLHDLSRDINSFKLEFPKVEFDVGHIAAAYRAGMMRAAQMAEDYYGPRLGAARAARRIAAAIRAEANATAAREALSNE